jgi:two-component system sensor histidine kinase KdpD
LSASDCHEIPAPTRAEALSTGFRFALQRTPFSAYLISAALVAVATILSRAAFNLVPEASLSLIYLLAVMISAQLYGLWPAIISSLLGLLAWDFFFTRPYFSFEISSERDVFTLIFFMVAALIMSGMTSQVRRQNRELALLASKNQNLYSFANGLATIDTVGEIASFAIQHISTFLRRDIALILNDRTQSEQALLFTRSGMGGEIMTEMDIAAALFLSSSTQSHIRRDTKLLPLVGLRGRVGAVKIGESLNRPISSTDEEQLSALLNQIAIAVERIWLSEEHRSASLAAETERMRNALLLSVSHDLRTPLTTIIGTLSTMELPQLDGKDGSRRELASIALTEAQRLDRFIANLLDMTRIELGGLQIILSPVNLEDVVASVVQRANLLLQNHNASVVVEDDLPPVEANFDLLEQAIFNLVDNAGRYCLPPADIDIRAFSDRGDVVIQIMDQGPGISEKLAQILFQKFARASSGDAKQSGTGLGLAITKGFIDAMGGSVSAANRSDQPGAVFTIRLPAARHVPVDFPLDTATSPISH